MITASEARQLIHKEAAITECKRQTQSDIERAIACGLSKVCLSKTSCYLKQDGTIGSYKDGVYIDCTTEIEEWLYSLGYDIRPTGYINGYYQQTKDICW